MCMISYNARVRGGRRFNKKDGFCKRRTACLLILEYAAGLKVPDGFNLKIDMTGCMRAIAASSAIERSASAEK